MLKTPSVLVGAGILTAAWLPAIGLLLVSGLCLAWLDLHPHDGAPLAVFFPPWWSASQLVGAAATAGVTIMRPGGARAVLLVRPGAPGSVRRLRAAGAWMVVDGRALGGCSNEFASR